MTPPHAPEAGVSCTDAQGRLPACAPLANPFVPFQQNNPQTYPAKKGVVRGTLFPGLDLPFMGMVNEHDLSDTPLHELQALGFALVELGEYLDPPVGKSGVNHRLRKLSELADRLRT